MVVLWNSLLFFWFIYQVQLRFGSQSIQFRFKMFILRKIIFRLLLFDMNTGSSSLVNFETKRNFWHSIIRIGDKFFPVRVFRDTWLLISFQIIWQSISNSRMLFWIVICQRLFARQKPLTTNLAKFIVNRLASSFRFYFHDSVFLQLFLCGILSTLYYAVLHLSELMLLKFQICFNYIISQ